MTTLLVVEDSATEAKILTDCLQNSGFSVISVMTAEAAKAILAQKNIDAILLDVVLPGQSGFGLCRELKRQKNTCQIPIILCSSKSGKMDKKWGIRQGATAYISKPIDPQEIVQTVQKILVDN